MAAITSSFAEIMESLPYDDIKKSLSIHNFSYPAEVKEKSHNNRYPREKFISRFFFFLRGDEEIKKCK